MLFVFCFLFSFQYLFSSIYNLGLLSSLAQLTNFLNIRNLHCFSFFSRLRSLAVSYYQVRTPRCYSSSLASSWRLSTSSSPCPQHLPLLCSLFVPFLALCACFLLPIFPLVLDFLSIYDSLLLTLSCDMLVFPRVTHHSIFFFQKTFSPLFAISFILYSTLFLLRLYALHSF